MSALPAGITLARVAGLGAGLGIVWDLLRPAGRRFPKTADLVFLAVCTAAWTELAFGICGGDLRPGYLAVTAAGGILWEQTGGRILRRAAGAVSRKFRKIFRFFLKKIQK